MCCTEVFKSKQNKCQSIFWVLEDNGGDCWYIIHVFEDSIQNSANYLLTKIPHF